MSSLQRLQSELLGLSRHRALVRAQIVTLLGDLAYPLTAAVVEVGGMALLREGGGLWVPAESVLTLVRHVCGTRTTARSSRSRLRSADQRLPVGAAGFEPATSRV